MNNDAERMLAGLELAKPREALRGRVISGVAAERFRARSGRVLRWAVAALVATLAWARVQEDRTAERMARAAAGASGIELRVEEKELGVLARALLAPRMPMPLPQGYPSTRRQVRLLSVDLDTDWPNIRKGA